MLLLLLPLLIIIMTIMLTAMMRRADELPELLGADELPARDRQREGVGDLAEPLHVLSI